MKQTAKLGIVLLSVFLLSFNAWAANDGSVGTTSSGDLDITLTVSEVVRIYALDNVTTTWTGGAVNLTEDACVYTNDASNNYQVRAYGSGASNVFTVEDAGADTIAYTVGWESNVAEDAVTADAGGAGGSSWDATTHQTDATDSITCGGGTNTTIHIDFTQSEVEALDPDTYSGTLYVVLQPAP